MKEFKYINLEEIYSQYFTFKNINDDINFWKSYPHIFFPAYDETRRKNLKISSTPHEIFHNLHLTLLNHHNQLSIINENNSNMEFQFKNLMDKYYFKDKDKDKKNKISTLNSGYEEYINSFDEIDRHSALETPEKILYENSEFFKLFNSLLYIVFEKYLKQIALQTTTPKDKTQTTFDNFDRKRNECLIQLNEQIINLKNMPTYKKLAIIIDKNCNILDDKKKVLNFFNKNKNLNKFNKYRNKIVHGDEFAKVPLTNIECFYIIKEVFDFMYKNDQILKQIDKVSWLLNPFYNNMK